MQVILKLYEDASSSKINFSVLWAGAYKNKIGQPGTIERSQFFIKILGSNFGNSILNNSNRHKISESITKKTFIWMRVRFSFGVEKDN